MSQNIVGNSKMKQVEKGRFSGRLGHCSLGRPWRNVL